MSGIDTDLLQRVEFQYYPANIFITEPIGVVTLDQLLRGIKNPKPKIKEAFLQIRKATEEGNNELKAKLKQQKLYSFTPSVISNGKGRTLNDIVDFNEIMIVEFDKIDFAEELKHVLFENLNCIIAAFLSPSGKGVKFIVRIPKPSSVEEYKEYFCGIAYYLDRIEGFDGANYNVILPLFSSWDENILIREDAVQWTEKGEKINAFNPNTTTDINKLPRKRVSKVSKQLLLDRICKMYDRINDNGHTQVVSNSTVIGGFVGAGRLDYNEAWSQIESCIRRNGYLSKGTRGYLKTAKQMFEKGILSPLHD